MKFIYFLPILASSFAQAENLPVIPDIQGYGTYEFGVIVKKLMPKKILNG